ARGRSDRSDDVIASRFRSELDGLAEPLYQLDHTQLLTRGQEQQAYRCPGLGDLDLLQSFSNIVNEGRCYLKDNELFQQRSLVGGEDITVSPQKIGRACARARGDRFGDVDQEIATRFIERILYKRQGGNDRDADHQKSDHDPFPPIEDIEALLDPFSHAPLGRKLQASHRLAFITMSRR